MNKKIKSKACEGFKTATDAARESRECLHSMPSSEEEKPHLWVNLLEVNEDLETSVTQKTYASELNIKFFNV